MALKNRLVNILFSLTEERRAARQQDVGQYSNTPNVNFAVVRLLAHNFWCHVKRASEHLGFAFGRIQKGCKSEISQLQSDVVGCHTLDQDIFRLDVSVDDILLVHIVDREQDLLHELGTRMLIKHFVFDDEVVQFTTRHQL